MARKDWPIEREIVKCDNLSCVYCGLEGKRDFQTWRQLLNGVDHLVPGSVAAVPSYTISSDNKGNLVTACWSCNSAKGRFNPLTAETVAVAKREDTTEEGWRQELILRARRHLEDRDWDYYKRDYEQMKGELGIS
jgi:5-methylcytosine-specific restriction endonuclease McrA